MSLYYLSKTHIEERKTQKLWQHSNAPRHANGAYQKEKGGGGAAVNVYWYLVTNHNPVYTAAGLLIYRESGAWPTPPSFSLFSPSWTDHSRRWVSCQKSQVLVESRGGCLTCCRSLFESICFLRQPWCFDLVLIHRRCGELIGS